MLTASFVSPLSYNSVDTYYGDNALLLQPEEMRAQLYAGPFPNDYSIESAPFPYFSDAQVGAEVSTPAIGYDNPSLFPGTSPLVEFGTQNLITTPPAVETFITGTPGDDVLSGNIGDNTLAGGRGHDIMIGAIGSDTFIFNHGDGRDTIRDFDATGPDHDVVDLGFNSFTNVADLMDIAQQHGDDVILAFGHGDRLTLDHVDLHDLNAGDFLF
jgi:hypothetical protein